MTEIQIIGDTIHYRGQPVAEIKTGSDAEEFREVMHDIINGGECENCPYREDW